MNIRFATCLVFASAVLVHVCGCERKPTPPSSPSASSNPSASNSADLTRYLEGQSRAAPSAGRSPPATGTPAPHPPVGVAPPPPAASGDPSWDVPEGWVTVKPSNAMRRAQYSLPRADGDTDDGELAVTYLGPQAGTVQNNLERWRGQFTTSTGAPVPDSDVKSETFDANGMRVTLLQVSGRFAPGPMAGAGDVGPRDDYRMLAAVVETPRGPWFFKATAPKATMEKHADAMRTLLKSVRP